MMKISAAVPFACALLIISHSPAAGQDIHQAAARGDRARVIECLEDDPRQVNALDQSGRTPLFMAVLARQVDIAALLIERGALVQVGDSGDRTPLHYAATSGQLEVIRLLIEHGAVVNARAVGAATPLHWSMWGGQGAAAELLLELGADPEAICNAEITPIYIPVLLGRADLLQMWLDRGMRLDRPDFLGRPPLRIAVENGFAGIVQQLIDHGVDPVWTDPVDGSTLLHLAAIHGHSEVAEVLLSHGLDPAQHDDAGRTAAECAGRYGHDDLAVRLGGSRTVGGERSSRATAILERDLGAGEVSILRMRGGSWGIRTQSGWFVFGYTESGVRPESAGLASGYLAAAELRDVTFHLINPGPPVQRLESLIRTSRTAHLVLPSGLQGSLDDRFENDLYPSPGQSLTDGAVTVTCLPGWAGRHGYHLAADGIGILWVPEIGDDYRPTDRHLQMITAVREQGLPVDIVLMSQPGGLGPERASAIVRIYEECRVHFPDSIYLPMGDGTLGCSVARAFGSDTASSGIFSPSYPGEGRIFSISNRRLDGPE